MGQNVPISCIKMLVLNVTSLYFNEYGDTNLSRSIVRIFEHIHSYTYTYTFTYTPTYKSTYVGETLLKLSLAVEYISLMLIHFNCLTPWQKSINFHQRCTMNRRVALKTSAFSFNFFPPRIKENILNSEQYNYSSDRKVIQTRKTSFIFKFGKLSIKTK